MAVFFCVHLWRAGIVQGCELQLWSPYLCKLPQQDPSSISPNVDPIRTITILRQLQKQKALTIEIYSHQKTDRRVGLTSQRGQRDQFLYYYVLPIREMEADW